MQHESTFDLLPAWWRREVKQLRRDCKTYRLRLRAAEQRIAELEAALATESPRSEAQISDLSCELGR